MNHGFNPRQWGGNGISKRSIVTIWETLPTTRSRGKRAGDRGRKREILGDFGGFGRFMNSFVILLICYFVKLFVMSQLRDFSGPGGCFLGKVRET